MQARFSNFIMQFAYNSHLIVEDIQSHKNLKAKPYICWEKKLPSEFLKEQL